MKSIITEEMRYRQRLCEYAKKNGVTKAARKYHTNRQFVYRQLEKYNGKVRSLALKSRRPHSHPKQHTESEKELILKFYKKYKNKGMAEIFVRLQKKGYTRCFSSMCRQIKKIVKLSKKKSRKSYVKYEKFIPSFPGELVQVDIKYIPDHSLNFKVIDDKYYQITAIDCYTRKRILKVVKEKSTWETSEFLETLEGKFGFKIKMIQTDNGREFINDREETSKLSKFEEMALELEIELKNTRPYSPWQNGQVERSHRLDSERLYNWVKFKSEDQMKKRIQRYETEYNNSAKQVLEFKSPNQILKEYISVGLKYKKKQLNYFFEESVTNV